MSDPKAAAETPFASHSDGGGRFLARPHATPQALTRPRYQLAIEALVHTTAQASQLPGMLPEHRRICELCTELKSVAEVSALLRIPLGVARVLVADLAEASMVAVYQPGGDGDTAYRPDTELLERVLSGLRQLPLAKQAGSASPSGRSVPDPVPPREEPIGDLAAKTVLVHDLPESLEQLVHDVGGVVDMEAGLREALLQSGYANVVEDLGEAVDVEAGLREALAQRPNHPDA